ncbi:MAG TPA: hypothetical protein VHX14_22830 [Thermoanaerobaculia bacterium]|nr:hypothetical protein [Thermoanaerobaculia bacterium]
MSCSMERRWLGVVSLALLFASCSDTPIQTPVDLEHAGTPIQRTIKFAHPQHSYAYGFAFRPAFVKSDHWDIRNYETESKKAWSEISPTVDITITDASGVVRMREVSRISHESGWTLTNGSSQDLPASVYKFIPFPRTAGERYQVRVSVVKGCNDAHLLTPKFFVEMPTASL